MIALSALVGWMTHNRMWAYGGTFLSINALGHLVLDTHVGRIRWFEPFSERWVYFFDVSSLYHPKILNFVFHWTFVFEIALVSTALYILVAQRKISRGK